MLKLIRSDFYNPDKSFWDTHVKIIRIKSPRTPLLSWIGFLVVSHIVLRRHSVPLTPILRGDEEKQKKIVQSGIEEVGEKIRGLHSRFKFWLQNFVGGSPVQGSPSSGTHNLWVKVCNIVRQFVVSFEEKCHRNWFSGYRIIQGYCKSEEELKFGIKKKKIIYFWLMKKKILLWI